MHESQVKRESTVRVALDRLEKLSAESEQLVEQLHSTFSSVLAHSPKVDVDQGAQGAPENVGSELGNALMRLSETMEENFRRIREGVIQAADI